MAGQSAAMVKAIEPCAEIIKELFDDNGIIESVTEKLK